jgi:hypothetical protein
LMHQHTGQAEFLFHATGQLAGRAPQKGQQVGKAKETFLAAIALGADDTEDVHEKIDIFLDRQVLVQAEALGHVSDAMLDQVFVLYGIEAFDIDGSGRRPDHGGDHSQKGGFSRSVGPQKPYGLPSGHADGRVVHGCQLAECFTDMIHLDIGLCIAGIVDRGGLGAGVSEARHRPASPV